MDGFPAQIFPVSARLDVCIKIYEWVFIVTVGKRTGANSVDGNMWICIQGQY